MIDQQIGYALWDGPFYPRPGNCIIILMENGAEPGMIIEEWLDYKLTEYKLIELHATMYEDTHEEAEPMEIWEARKVERAGLFLTDNQH